MSVVFGLIWLHWLADFVFQTDKMAMKYFICEGIRSLASSGGGGG